MEGYRPPKNSAHAARSAVRARLAILKGRSPGFRGRPRRFGSLGGAHGARQQQRRLNALSVGRVPGKAGKPGGKPKAKQTQLHVRMPPRKDVASESGVCVLVETWCGARSRTAWAAGRRGAAAIRVAKAIAKGAPPEPPNISPGNAVTWRLNLQCPSHRTALRNYVHRLAGPRFRVCGQRVRKLAHITSPVCKEWSPRNIVNRRRRKPAELKKARQASIKDVKLARALHKVVMRRAGKRGVCVFMSSRLLAECQRAWKR